MLYLLIISLLVLFLWFCAGCRAYLQLDDRVFKKFFLHILIAIVIVILGVSVIYYYREECQSQFLCGVREAFYSLIFAGIILLIYPIVLLVIWKSKKTAYN